jgi:hypothetical protein
MDEKQFPTFEQLHQALGPDMMSWMHDMVSPDKPPVGGRSVGAKPKKGKKRTPISFASPSQSLTPFSPSENALEAQGDLQPQSSPRKSLSSSTCANTLGRKRLKNRQSDKRSKHS